jgi:5-methylcytosine-specific restriction protein B
VQSGFTQMEFPGLYEEFINSDYLDSLDGMRHLDAYEEERVQGRRNFESVLEARERGEDVTDLVLLKLLPHNDTEGNRERGAWVHIAPAIQKDIKTKYEGAGWTKPEDWPAIAEGFDRREARRSRPARSGCDYAPPCVPPFEIFDR